MKSEEQKAAIESRKAAAEEGRRQEALARVRVKYPWARGSVLMDLVAREIGNDNDNLRFRVLMWKAGRRRPTR